MSAVHQQVYEAVRDGVLIRPDRCERCGEAGRVVGHHDDYAKPLTVRWLCAGCHRRWHVENGTAPGQGEVTTSVRIERDSLDAFRAVAAANRRSVSQELRWLIDRHIAEAREPSKAAA